MLRSQIQRAACLATLAAIASVGAARAGTITVFTNFSGTPPYSKSSYFPIGSPEAVAMPFTAGSTADLADAVLALSHISGDNSPITLDLESNSSSGVPGTILGTLTQQGALPVYPTINSVTFDYTGAPLELTSGTSYWLVAVETDSSSSQSWWSSKSDTGTYAYNFSDSATGPWAETSGTIAAFQVDGTPVPAAPEPSSCLLLAMVMVFGLGALWRQQRERRRALSHGRA